MQASVETGMDLGVGWVWDGRRYWCIGVGVAGGRGGRVFELFPCGPSEMCPATDGKYNLSFMIR